MFFSADKFLRNKKMMSRPHQPDPPGPERVERDPEGLEVGRDGVEVVGEVRVHEPVGEGGVDADGVVGEGDAEEGDEGEEDGGEEERVPVAGDLEELEVDDHDGRLADQEAEGGALEKVGGVGVEVARPEGEQGEEGHLENKRL